MYCEKDLAGATLAAGEESQYFSTRGRRLTWLWVILILGGGGAAGYWFWYVPWQRGVLVKEARIGAAHVESLDASADGTLVTVSLEGAPGAGSVVIEPADGTPVGIDGALPLNLSAKVKRGGCRVKVSAGAGFATLKIWMRAP